MLILHVSDTHLGAAPGGLLFRFRDVMDAFKETVDIAIRERVDLYLHAGDFFDRATPPAEAYLVAYKHLKRLKESGIKVIIVAGQHDLPRRYGISPLSLLEEVGVVDRVFIGPEIERMNIEVGSVRYELVAVPYSARGKIELAKPRTKHSILVAHLLLKELGIPTADASVASIPTGYSYVALGDYHGTKMFRTRDGAPVVYPGATEVFRRDEYSENGKKVALVDLSGDEPSVQFIKLTSVRPWIIGTFDSVKQALEYVRSAVTKYGSYAKKPIVVLTVRGREPLNLLMRELEALTRSNLIEHYVVEREGDTESEDRRTIVGIENVEKLDLRKLIEIVVADQRLAELVYDLVQDPCDACARKLVEALLNDPQLLEAARKAFASMRSTIVANYVGKRSSNSTTSSKSFGYGLGLLRFHRGVGNE